MKRLHRTILCLLIAMIAAAPLALAQNSKVDNARPAPPFDPTERLPGPSLSFFVFGHWGIGGKEQRAISDALITGMKRDGASAVLTTGGNFPGAGVATATDVAWDARFESAYPADPLDLPFWATLGEDDHKGNADAQIAYSNRSLNNKARSRWHMPAAFWTTVFTAPGKHLRVRVIGLDTRDFVNGDPARAQRQSAWLDSTLRDREEEWTIVVGHHPVYSNGAQGNTLGMLRWVKPLLEKYRVDAYVGGRDHDVQLLAPVKGVRYFVSGGGSKSADTRWADNTIFAATNLGLLWMECNEKTMLVRVLDRDGAVIFSHKSDKSTN